MQNFGYYGNQKENFKNILVKTTGQVRKQFTFPKTVHTLALCQLVLSANIWTHIKPDNQGRACVYAKYAAAYFNFWMSKNKNVLNREKSNKNMSHTGKVFTLQVYRFCNNPEPKQ